MSCSVLGRRRASSPGRRDRALRAGAGYLAGLTSRSDIGHYTPIPGVLPVASVGFGLFDLEATYVPGLLGTGNVAFSWIKIAIPW